MINLGSATISKLRLGNKEVVKAYLGTVQVYPSGESFDGCVQLVVTIPSDNYEFNLWHMMEGDSASSTYTAGNVPQYDFEVDWGDGSNMESYTNNTWKNAIHTYTTAGDKTISIYGTFEYLGLTGYSTSSSPTGQATMQLLKSVQIGE